MHLGKTRRGKGEFRVKGDLNICTVGGYELKCEEELSVLFILDVLFGG